MLAHARSPILLTLLVLSSQDGTEAPIWSPPPGATLVQSHALQLESELTSLVIRLLDTELDPRDVIEDYAPEAWSPGGRLRVRATDTELRLAPAPPLAGTEPLAFLRSYRSSEARGPLGRSMADALPSSPVRFRRASVAEPFVRTDLEGHALPELAPLAEDLSWRLLLPGSRSAPGAAWALELDAAGAATLLAGVFDPGAFAADRAAVLEAAPAAADDPFAPRWREGLARLSEAFARDGRVEVAWDEPPPGERVDARAFVPLTLQGGLATELDVANWLPDFATFQTETGESLPTATEAGLTLDLTLDGRCLWSREDAIAREAELTLEGTATLAAEIRPRADGLPIPLVLRIEARWDLVLRHASTIELK